MKNCAGKNLVSNHKYCFKFKQEIQKTLQRSDDKQTHACLHAESLQSCPILRNSMNRSLPGFSVHAILQTRILEWVAMPSTRGSSQPRDRIWNSPVSCIGRQIFLNHCTTWKANNSQCIFSNDGYQNIPSSFH